MRLFCVIAVLCFMNEAMAQDYELTVDCADSWEIDCLHEQKAVKQEQENLQDSIDVDVRRSGDKAQTHASWLQVSAEFSIKAQQLEHEDSFAKVQQRLQAEIYLQCTKGWLKRQESVLPTDEKTRLKLRIHFSCLR